MSFRYVCQKPRRRDLVDEHPSLNGIDFLEVLDSEAPEPALAQRTLLVRCLKALPAGFSAANVRVEGGVRVTPVKAEWAAAASETAGLLAASLITPAEAAFYAAEPEPDQLLLVRTDSCGDYSTYTLRLVASPSSADPPPGFDPILAQIGFSFKVECPSEFDCWPAEECPTEVESAPALNYLAKDYPTFERLIYDRLAILAPEWQERAAPDLAVALVELLAYAGDALSYFQDAAATEAYLGTARRRASLRRHARLLAYPMHDGCNARVWVQLQVEAGGAADGASLPARDPVSGLPTRFVTRMPAGLRIAEEELAELLSLHPAAVFELAHDVSLGASHNEIRFHTWGDEACCLPAGATRATLQSSAVPADALQLQAGDALIFEEALSPTTGLAADADRSHRWAVRLTAAVAGQDDLLGQPIVEVEWAAEDALPFPLCLSAEVAGSLLLNMSVARGNVALADHGRTRQGEALPRPAGHRRYRPYLQERDITFRAEPDPTAPASQSLVQEPRAALPAVSLAGGGEMWRPQRDLLNSDRFATEFVLEMDNDSRGQLRFGDGLLFGQAPSPNVDLAVEYRIGNGPAGNIGAEALGHYLAGLAGISAVRNPLPAAGGAAPESLDEVRLYAPRAFRRQERAVTPADYAAATERQPEVQRARATRRWTGSWHTMFVTVDRKRGLAVDVAFEEEVRLWLERFRLAGHDIEVDGPRFVPLEVIMTVCARPGHFPADVKAALLEAFSNRTLADGRHGFFHPDNLTFGQPVYASQIVAAAMGVAAVQWVDLQPGPASPNRFQRWGQTDLGAYDQGYLSMGRLEIARLDNDPSRPENGKIEFIVIGGQT
ncbi:MAG: putative baseplate assembly protein [Candidatus Promineifilaceae bacterium]